jgi:hypothetical protein
VVLGARHQADTGLADHRAGIEEVSFDAQATVWPVTAQALLTAFRSSKTLRGGVKDPSAQPGRGVCGRHPSPIPIWQPGTKRGWRRG